jgi:hypothetical protein
MFLLTAILLLLRKAVGPLGLRRARRRRAWLGDLGGRVRLVATRATRRLIILLGLWMLTPWIRRPLGFRSPTGISYGANPWPLAAPGPDRDRGRRLFHDDGPRTTRRAACRPRSPATPTFGGTVTDGEWHQYGRTPFGQRYSPLDQINAEQRRQPQGGVALPDRRRQAAGRCRRDDLSGDAAEGRRHALSLHAAQLGDRARRHDRQGEMEIRRQLRHEPGPAAPDLPRRHLLCRCRRGRRRALRRARLPADLGCPADRARRGWTGRSAPALPTRACCIWKPA